MKRRTLPTGSQDGSNRKLLKTVCANPYEFFWTASGYLDGLKTIAQVKTPTIRGAGRSQSFIVPTRAIDRAMSTNFVLTEKLARTTSSPGINPRVLRTQRRSMRFFRKAKLSLREQAAFRIDTG